MTVISIILGVLLLIGGFSFIFTPLVTFMQAGYFIIILFFISGIFGIIRAVSAKRYGADFVFSIISLILGVPGLVMPGAAMMNDFVILYFAAAYFLLLGILTVVRAVGSKKAGASTGMMAFGIILGILEILLGVYSIAHPLVLAVTIGFLIGFYFIEAGINMILLGLDLSKKKSENDA